MTALEIFYETNYHFKTKPRKEIIKDNYKYIQIVSPHNSGKTYFVLDFLKNNFKSKEYLYIDCDDIRFNGISCRDLNNFILMKSIDILVFDNYNSNLNIDFKQLKIKKLILCLTLKLDLPNFYTIELFPLDFEQFLVFGNFIDSKIAFNYFLKYGNFPASINLEEFNQIKYLQNSIKINSQDDTEVYIRRYIYLYIAQKRSLLEIYQKIKDNIKISKDRFYAFVKYLQNIKEIFLVQHYFKSKAPKKIYLYNPALFGAVSFIKKFNNIFSNYIFLELFYRFKDIYYLDNIDFYIPSKKLIVICMPFVNEEILSIKSKAIINLIVNTKIDISQIQIVTNSTENVIFIEDIECEIIPFYSWALSF